MKKNRFNKPCNKCDVSGTLNSQKPFDLRKKILK